MAPSSLPPGIHKHRLVYLEAIHCPLPIFDFDCDIIEYQTTQPAEVAQRIKDATIVVATICPVTRADLEKAPYLQLLAVRATGMGWVDKSYCAERGITVVNSPQTNVEALGEHFLGLYFASRRKIPENHFAVTQTREWLENGSLRQRWRQGPPLSCAKEILGIVGHGFLGRRFEELAKATGFGKIVICERKGVSEARTGRVTFDELIRTATTIVICCPLDESTRDLIAEPEFEAMMKEALIINMARGGIVNEAALAQALQTGKIFGAATDVLLNEPGGPGSSPLLPDTTKGENPIPNLIISPHIAWYAERTLERLNETLKEGVDGYVLGYLQEGSTVKNCVAVYEGKVWK